MRVSKQVISVNALEMEFVVTHLSVPDTLLSLMHHRLDSILVRVLFLFKGPVFVIIIEAVLVKVNFLVNLELFDKHAFAAKAHEPLEWTSEHKIESISEEEHSQESCWSTLEQSLCGKCSVPKMLGLEWLTLG